MQKFADEEDLRVVISAHRAADLEGKTAAQTQISCCTAVVPLISLAKGSLTN